MEKSNNKKSTGQVNDKRLKADTKSHGKTTNKTGSGHNDTKPNTSGSSGSRRNSNQ